jgi:CRISPR system Cascade subunit CasE
MYLSRLLIQLGDNPDRPRPGRLWLRNIYRVHQRLCMAFPSQERVAADPNFLMPYDPEEFPEDRQGVEDAAVQPGQMRQVHVPRNGDAGFLFRVDSHHPGSAVILILSAIEPNWEYAFHNAQHLLAAPPQVSPFDPQLKTGGKYRFRLRANPTKSSPKIRDERGFGRERTDGKIRRGRGRSTPLIHPADLHAWLEKKIEKAGGKLLSPFEPAPDTGTLATLPELLIRTEGIQYIREGRRPTRFNNPAKSDAENAVGNKNALRLRIVTYEGVLEISDPIQFVDMLKSGIGRGKAFGCGLLSLAPLP